MDVRMNERVNAEAGEEKYVSNDQDDHLGRL